MGTYIAATTKASEAPDVQPGLCDAVFSDLSMARVEGGDYGEGKVVTIAGQRYNRYRWDFQLLDDDGKPLYDERKVLSDGEPNENFGNPIFVDSLTSLSMNATSKTKPKSLRYLSALLSKQEYETFLESSGLDADALKGRKVQVEIAIKDSGWPTIVNVLPARVSRRSSAPAFAEQDTSANEMFRA